MAKEDWITLNPSISFFALSENIEITIYDKNENLVSKFNTIENRENIVEKDYDIINGKDIIGTMVISYSEMEKFDKLSNDFRKNMLITLSLIGGLAACIGMVTSYFLSKKLTKSIAVLNMMTQDYKNKEYENSYPLKSKINEVDDLKLNMTYLGESLKKQEELRSIYSQNISHELKTPLANFLITMEAIEDGVIDLNQETILSLKDEVSHLNYLVDKLRLSFNEENIINDSRIALYNLSEIVEKIYTNLLPTSQANSISLKKDIDSNIYIESDKEKIIQILYNLISNAFKACKPGDKILIKLKTDKNYIFISVIDNGKGIGDEDLDKIFLRNYRVLDNENQDPAGSGLGLSISKSLAGSIGGKILVKSKLGSGSTFSLQLPSKI